jgi:hypothetical protein
MQKQPTKVDNLARLLEVLPSPDEFLNRIKELENPTAEAALTRYTIPYLKELHEVIHELLPKPNKGLWEPGLNLDHFILSYYTLAYQNYEYQQKMKNKPKQQISLRKQMEKQKAIESDEEEEEAEEDADEEEDEEDDDNASNKSTHFIRSKL